MTDTSAWVYGALNLLQGLVLAAIPLSLPIGSPVADGVVLVLAALFLLSGPLVVLGGRAGRMVATATCLLSWVVGVVLAALIAGSASYLFGIYGELGRVMGVVAVALAAGVALVFWLLPAHELAWLRRMERSA